MPYLVIAPDHPPASITVELDGGNANVQVKGSVLVVELEDSDAGAALTLASESGTYRLPPDEVERFAAPTAEEATPIVVSDVHLPTQSTFSPRVKDQHAQPLTDGTLIAGLPGTTPLPVNYVAEKQTASYLSIRGGLGNEEHAFGDLRELETYWEPLGWALDEWIDTFSLAPFEDTVHSGVHRASDASRQEARTAESRDESRAETGTRRASSEAMQTGISTAADSRGWTASLGGPATGVGAPANPILALAHGVIGTFQVGVDTAKTAISGEISADLRKEEISRLEQKTSQDRTANNKSLASVVGRWRESRRLRAVRNLSQGRSQNVAMFSLVRQWLVSTADASSKPIVLIRAHQIDRPFEQAEILEHHTTLAAGLLERRLADALDRCAMTAQLPASTDKPTNVPDSLAERVTGQLVVSDPAKGRGSTIRMSVLFDTGDEDEAVNVDIVAQHEGPLSFEIPLEGRPLRKLGGWRFEFINPGLKLDQKAAVTPVEVAIATADGPVKVEIAGGQIELTPGNPKTFPRGFETLDHVAAQPVPGGPSSEDLQRVLSHLNAKRPYYRLLIDLSTDPITRFVRLTERRPRPPMPADMRPVGVAGAHLAFLIDKEGASSREVQPPIKRIMSTPAGGAFVEVLEGQTEVAAASPAESWPRVALAQGSSLPWPGLVDLPAVQDSDNEDSRQAPPLAAEPTAPEAELPTKLAEVMTMLEKLTATVESLKPSAPEASTAVPPANGTPAGESDGDHEA